MKKLNLIFILLSVVAISLLSVPAYSHVIPEDELRNQIYLSTNEALKRAEIISRAILDQYLNKSAESDFSAVTSNQGPTTSTQALNQAVHKILILHKILYLDSRN
jgi:hypothetical protein